MASAMVWVFIGNEEVDCLGKDDVFSVYFNTLLGERIRIKNYFGLLADDLLERVVTVVVQPYQQQLIPMPSIKCRSKSPGF